MKNNLKQIIFAVVTGLSFTALAHAQPVMEDQNGCVYYNEAPAAHVHVAPVAHVAYVEPVTHFDGDINHGYGYVSVGVGPLILTPNVGLGYRERHANLGWDTSIGASSTGYHHAINGHVVGHLYLSPTYTNSGYVGLGLMGSSNFDNYGHVGGTVSPDLVFGKEFSSCSRQFVEMHVGVPTWFIKGHQHGQHTYVPLVYLKYGTSF